MTPKFEITVDTSAYDESTLPEALRPAKYVAKINGHSYASSHDSADEAIAKAVRLLAEELGRVNASGLFETMSAKGDFATSAFSRAESAQA